MKSNYPTKKLGEILELCDSGIWGDELPGGLPLLRSTNMQNGELVLDDVRYINVSKDKIDRYILREGDILVTKSSGSVDHIGKSLFITKKIDGKYGFSNFTQRLRANQKLVLPKWIYLKISNPATRDFLLSASQTTTGLRNLKISALKELEIPVPSIVEQKKIVAKLEKLLAKTKEVKRLRTEAQEATQNLLSAELHKIFEQGKKKGWEEKELENLIDTITPPVKIQKKNFRQTGKYPVIDQSQDEISGWTDDLDALVKIKTPVIIFGDHTCAIKYSDKYFAQGADGIKILKTNQSLLPRFLYLILKNQQIKSEGYRRHFSKLKKIKILLPPLTEQKKIITHLDSLSEKIKKLQEYQKSTASIFTTLEQSILSKAFSGKLIAEPEKIKVQRTREQWFAIKQGIGAVLEKLAQTPFERGEMVIAKYMYFLQEVYKLPFGLNFVPHNFGPYDPDIKRAIIASAFSKDKYFKVKGSGEMQVYSLGDNASQLFKYQSRILGNSRAALNNLITHIANAKSSDIERLATVCKIIQDNKTTDLRIVQEKMEEWKPGKFNNEQIKKTLDFILAQGWNKNLLDK